MADFTPLVNGIEHSFADIDLRLFNVPVAGIKAIAYKNEREMTNIMAAGKHPVARSYGPNNPTSSITLLLNEVIALQRSAPNGNLDEIPEFDIPVSYLAEGSTNQVTDIIHNCRFKSNGRDAKQGDSEMAIEIELIISHITWAQ